MLFSVEKFCALRIAKVVVFFWILSTIVFMLVCRCGDDARFMLQGRTSAQERANRANYDAELDSGDVTNPV